MTEEKERKRKEPGRVLEPLKGAPLLPGVPEKAEPEVRKVGRPRKYENPKDVSELLAAVRASGGYILKVAEALGVPYWQARNRVRSCPTASEALEEERAARDERFEMALEQCAATGKGNAAAIAFYLERRCADRYGKKTPDTQITVSNEIGALFEGARRRLEKELGRLEEVGADVKTAGR